MSISDIKDLENAGKRALEQFPFLKTSAKRLYQSVSVAVDRNKFKVVGDLERVSPEDGYEYFYGYYDKSPWDVSCRYLLCMRVSDSWRSPAPDSSAIIGVIDLDDSNRFIPLAQTSSWNVQQGCMAQWLGPDFKSKIIYNDFRNGKFCSVIYDFKERKEERVLSLPVYDVSRDGTFALSLDFSRLHRLRPGYGYVNLPDLTQDIPCPNEYAVFRLELSSDSITPLFKYTDLASFEPLESMRGAEHKVNHIMISPDGSRFMLLHRWFKEGRKYTRLVTADSDGTDLYNLSDDTFVSHCFWKNDSQILSFLRKNETGDHYYLLKDKSKEHEMFWPQLKGDGHCSYSPDGELVVTDTYPDRKRHASLYICSEYDNKVRKIASVYSPFRYDNACRCDLHPRWSRDGRKICIDSVHEGRRALYLIDVPDIDPDRYNRCASQNREVTVLLASYNGARYLSAQIDSVLAQKGVHVRLIVRDDGSSDGTQKILQKYAESGKLEWYQGEHLGVQHSFLELLRKAPDSDFYAFCDQDDIWDDNKLLIAVTELSVFPTDKPALYYCGQRVVDKDLKLISTHNISDSRSRHTDFLIGNAAGCTEVFNHKLAELVNSASPDYILMHDSWLLKICISTDGNYFADPAAHISYRQHGNNSVGLDEGFTGKLGRAKRYIDSFEIRRQVESLYVLYSNLMTNEYRTLCHAIMHCDSDILTKVAFMAENDIDFGSAGLNSVVLLKILLGKM